MALSSLPTCIRLYDTAIRLGQLQAQFKLAIDPVEYARDNLKFGLVEVVYEWAKVCVYDILFTVFYMIQKSSLTFYLCISGNPIC